MRDNLKQNERNWKKWKHSQQNHIVVEVFTVAKEHSSQYMDATFTPKTMFDQKVES